MKKINLLKKVFAMAIVMAGISTAFAVDMSTTQAKKYRERFVEELKKYVGCPYEFGAVGPNSFDCSGLINYAASQAIEIQLPRTARAMYSSVTIVPAKKREPGDLLFFKTTGTDSISHVGVYIGNDQFISAISDGANTGVIVSSLKQDYWKPKYVATGQFLPSGDLLETLEDESGGRRMTAKADRKDGNRKDDVIGKNVEKTGARLQTKNNPDEKNKAKDVKKGSRPRMPSSSYRKDGGSFSENFVMDASFFLDWTLLSSKSFSFQFRGVDLNVNARYAKWDMEPGVGMTFRYNYGLGVFQMPVVISATINDYFRAYAGPVFTFGKARLPATEKEVSPSIFPGVIGVAFTTETLNLGIVDLQFAQDISYTVYNSKDKSALPILESLSAGLIFYTGVKVSLPLSAITG